MTEQLAVVDRIVDGKHAVLLVGVEEVERVVLRDALPAGVREGTWLKVIFEGDRLVSVKVDAETTERRKQRIGEKMDRLRRRRRGQP